MTDTKSIPVLPVDEDADAAFEAWWREYQKHRAVKITTGRWVPSGEIEALKAEVERLRGEAAAWKEHSEAAERFRKSAVAEAEAEVERLRNALAAISLDEYESTSSASEKVHGHARIARKALYGEK